jgi:hypothetical protein
MYQCGQNTDSVPKQRSYFGSSPSCRHFSSCHRNVSVKTEENKHIYGILQCFSRYNEGLWAGRPCFDSWRGHKILLFSTASRLAQPPLHWLPGALSSGVKRPRRDAQHQPLGRSSNPEGVNNYLHVVQTGSGVHPASYPMGTGGFPRG